ncbi:transglutaminase domain-containing protein [Occultella glacieicola]|uniref:Transglutaminase domain-containing protein n=1 Tax=Occultella glacieicola TaxID=2518684 RepID=A0ABY2E042_9MICO|nr:transglutaminase domain-containing protein [Occultella glacieicola]TDE89968.1 transglutaminase domain-containing protein [Occultella glacieicola]
MSAPVAAVDPVVDAPEPAPSAPRPTWLTWFTRARVVNAVVPVVLLAMALAPLQQVYLTRHLFITIIGGLLLGGGIAVLGAMRRLSTLTVLAVSLVVFFLCGALAAPTTAIAGILPTPTTWRVMGLGVVTVWKSVLTLDPPLGTGGGLLLLPYLLAFFGALISVTVSLRAKHFTLSLIPPALVLIASILFGTRLSVLAGVLGIAGVLISLTWVAWRADRLEPNRILAASIVLGLAALGGTTASVFAAPDNPRVVLRDFVDPPPDPQDYSSPLAGFRNYVDEQAEETVFTVTGLPAGTERIRLAALDSYNGTVWNVAGGDNPGTGAFMRTGERIAVDVPENAVSTSVSVDGYRGVWLPNVGNTLDVDFTTGDVDALTDSFYYNATTDTGLVTRGLAEGDGYELVSAPAAEAPSDVTQLVASRVAQPSPRSVPDIVGSLAGQWAADANSDYAKVEALASALSTQGFFSHGLVGEVPSRPGHGAARLLSMFEGDQMVGDAEQYAAVMALMVRELGYPARVVMGFEVPTGADAGAVAITGENVTAWVEVPFDGVGWLPFFPTPDEDQIPQSEDPDPVDRPQPQVLQPPPPPQEPPDVPPQDRDDADVEDQQTKDEESFVRWLLIGAAVGGPILLLLSPFIVIAAIKARRRKRRRVRGVPVQRIAGGWSEVEDQAVDLGVTHGPGATRREAAGAFDEAFPAAGTAVLARRADASVFAPDLAGEDEAVAYWRDVRGATDRLRHGVNRRRRLRARFSLRSLRRR